MTPGEKIKYKNHVDDKRELSTLKRVIECSLYVSPDAQEWEYLGGASTHGGQVYDDNGDLYPHLIVSNSDPLPPHNGMFVRCDIELFRQLELAVFVDYA